MFFSTPDNNASENNVSKIKLAIFGIGGGGCNAVNRLMANPKDFPGVKFIAANTDAMALDQVNQTGVTKIYLGKKITEGMGAGSNPEVGKRAANESKEEIINAIQGNNLIFITAGIARRKYDGYTGLFRMWMAKPPNSPSK